RHRGVAVGRCRVSVLGGIFAWLWAASAIAVAANALTGQARLVTVLNVPREIFPVGRVAGRFAEYVAGLPILVGVAAVYALRGRIDPGVELLALPLALLVQAVLLVGVALLLSALNVLVRDVERVMRLVLRVLFYATPIIYPLSLVRDSPAPGWCKAVYELNPLVGIVQLHHAAWYPDEFPDTRLLVTSVVGSLLVLVAGRLAFRRLEPAVLKEL
ncbi:ABC transporter permease, partial [Micromonospora echinospora]|uniref:ABC transporter permease n=1 Tax=Micromonospora echinospora TaxID=1877 RepID=UPI00366ED242